MKRGEVGTGGEVDFEGRFPLLGATEPLDEELHRGERRGIALGGFTQSGGEQGAAVERVRTGQMAQQSGGGPSRWERRVEEGAQLGDRDLER